MSDPLPLPGLDPTPIFELFRGSYATELLTAAVAHFDVFGRLGSGGRTFEQLRYELGMEERPAHVLVTALRAMGFLAQDTERRLTPSCLAHEHLTRGQPFDVSRYIGLAADSPGVLAMVDRLRTNRPAKARPDDAGAAYIFREGLDSAMDEAESARRLTLALAGRARNVAPVLAQRHSLEGSSVLLDVGGGSGLYSIAWLLRHPRLRAIVWDRPAVLTVAAELAAEHGVADRLECRPGDMFADPVPAADVVLFSNVLHDWDVPQCRDLIARCAAMLPGAGQLLIHDVFLDDDLGGPLPVALYSAALFSLTEGRAYSAAEYRDWITRAGLSCRPITPTLIHCGVLAAGRQSRDG